MIYFLLNYQIRIVFNFTLIFFRGVSACFRVSHSLGLPSTNVLHLNYLRSLFAERISPYHPWGREMLSSIILAFVVLFTLSSSAYVTIITPQRSSIALFSAYEAVDKMFDPDAVESRNAASRTSGYWRYVQKGKDPPLEFTYGESPLSSLEKVIQSMITHHLPSSSPSTLLDQSLGRGGSS